MNKCIVPLAFLAAVLTIGTLANAGATSVPATDRNLIGSARSNAIHVCNIDANKFSSITQLSNQLAVYGTCMATHRQRFG
jgi:hypothetical protein